MKVTSDDIAIDPMAPKPVLDFDDPKVRIAFRLTRDIGVGFGFGNKGAIECFKPAEPTVEITHLAHHPASRFKLVELQDHNTAVRISASDDDDWHTFGTAPPHVRLDPEFCGESSFCHDRQSNHKSRH